MSLSLLKYVLTAALRDRLVIALALLIIITSSLSVFLGSAATVEQDQFALVFGAAGLRTAGVLGLVLFVVFYIRRSFDTKDVEFMLSRPISRIEFLISIACAFALIALLMTLAQGFAIYILSPHLFGTSHLLWITSIAAENVIMVIVAMFFAMILSSASSAAMACAGFYILARLMGQVLGIIDSGMTVYGLEIFNHIMQVISAVMPRLDLMGQASWLIYGIGDGVSFGFVMAQGLVFAVFILLASLIDLVRREF